MPWCNVLYIDNSVLTFCLGVVSRELLDLVYMQQQACVCRFANARMKAALVW